MDSDYKMYVLINTDLKIGTGKKISQAAHAVQAVTEVMCNSKKDLLKRYKTSGQTKIVLKATEQQMMELINVYEADLKYILDAGHTQVAAGSLTALAFYPMLPDAVPEVVQKMKLL